MASFNLLNKSVSLFVKTLSIFLLLYRIKFGILINWFSNNLILGFTLALSTLI